MVIKYLALKPVIVAEEVSQEGGVIHAKRDSEAWRAYFELKQRERGARHRSHGAGDIPPDLQGNYFL